ncbi:hypothetical protein B0A48_01894 [Cryoendolithus antarcticus]|uniref:Mitotic checkpoint regulator, MAD2B-interacting-domain-containing protein n=1 Tax=Cryoendolithus antarcticus TaxID=1507870 RepID=A0A1V8TQQ1_9PEZI|nr:hypothetical protein B0A48_01894 [Cryoendolithus antarcticus]
MALVAYSDSETSDSEPATAPAKVAPAPTAPPAKFATKRGARKKITFELPSIKAEPGQSQGSEEPVAKKVKTSGSFTGFNSLLPPPTRTSQGNAPKPGVSLRTSSEAAFSRAPPPRTEGSEDIGGYDDAGEDGGPAVPAAAADDDPAKEPAEVKTTGKATRFMPLSVANAKKKKKPMPAPAQKPDPPAEDTTPRSTPKDPDPPTSAPSSQPKPSLFSITRSEDIAVPSPQPMGFYTPEFSTPSSIEAPNAPEPTSEPAPLTNANTLSDIASDMNLTPAQRRQLFGRHGAPETLTVTHFNMDAEYASNRELLEKGEAVQHRAVKAVAPGKHSLQQLVNNVKSQGEALEDKWAEGRRNRGEAGSKYGF